MEKYKKIDLFTLELGRELCADEKIDKILSNYERKSQASIITSKGFSMKDTVRFLEKVYSRLAV